MIGLDGGKRPNGKAFPTLKLGGLLNGCQSKNRGGISPKMDGENNGKTLLKWMIWGVFPLFLETSIFWENSKLMKLQGWFFEGDYLPAMLGMVVGIDVGLGWCY